MSRKILSLDIQPDGVAAVMIKSGIQDHSIVDGHYSALAKNIDFEEALSNSLDEISKKMDLKGAACVVAIPPNDIFFRNPVVPFTQDRKIRQVLPFELEPTLPFSAEEIRFDFLRVQSQPEKSSLLLAGCIAKSAYERLESVLAAHGIKPKTITIGGQALVQAAKSTGETSKDWLLLDCANTHYTLFIISENQVHVVRTIPVAKENYTDTVSTVLSQTLTIFRETVHAEYRPECMMITGENTDAVRIEKVGEATGCSRIVPFSVLYDLPLFKNTEGVGHPWHGDRMERALALSVAEIKGSKLLNFAQESTKITKIWSENRTAIVRSGAIAIIVVLLALGKIYFDFSTLEKQVGYYDAQIQRIFNTTFPEVTRVVDPIHQMQTKIREFEEATFLSIDENSRPKVVDLLLEISKRIPPSVRIDLDRLVISSEGIIMSGTTGTFNAVDEMKNVLEQSSYFKKVSITSTNKDKVENNINFKLKLSL